MIGPSREIRGSREMMGRGGSDEGLDISPPSCLLVFSIVFTFSVSLSHIPPFLLTIMIPPSLGQQGMA